MTSPVPRKKRSLRRVLLIQALVLCATLALCEVGWRVVLAVRGQSHSAASAREDFQTSLTRARDFVPRGPRVDGDVPAPDRAQSRLLHPFLAWENFGGLEQVQAESTRLGRPEFDGDVEVLTLGGSVADMFGHFGVPRLEQRLRADPRFTNKRFYWYRYARGGFKQPQQLNFLAWFLGQGYTPEIVINIDGFNEAALASDNVARGSSPLYPSIVHWGQLASGGAADREMLDLATAGRAAQVGITSLADRALRYGVAHSAIATTFVTRRLQTLQKQSAEAYEAYARRMRETSGEFVLRGPPFPAEPEAAAASSARMWAECSRNVRAICEARGIFYLHVLQPTLHDPGAKTATDEEKRVGGINDAWLRGVLLTYPLLRARGTELAAGGEHFVDATGVFRDVTNTIYVDNCHFREDGNRILADRIADELLARYPRD
jgi:hypothetical protein